MGLGLLDEIEIDTIPAAASPSPSPPRLRSPRPPHPTMIPVTGETGPRALAVPMTGERENWRCMGQQFIAGIQSAEELAESSAGGPR